MSSAPWTKPLRRAAWAAMLSVAVIGLTGSAFAQGQQPQAQNDDDIEDHVLNSDKRMLNAILAPLGLGSNSGPAIEYRERSPLVVPQGRNLPPPGKSTKNGDWPVEPEIKAKREEAALRRQGKDPDARVNLGRHDERPISGTTEQWRTGNVGTWSDDPKRQAEDGFFTMMWKGRLTGSWSETGKFEGEPPRTSLVDPPAGYLTPSAAAPYGVTPRDPFANEKKEKKP